jgi:hypothetical protein
VVTLCVLALAAVTGCRTFFETPSDDANVAAGGSTGLISSGSSTEGGGEFIDVGGDMMDQRPEEVDVEEEGEETFSNFRAVQVDPVSEDTAGPKFIESFDMDNDGLPDLVTGWNESQPIQLHLQRRDAEGGIRFVSVNLGGTAPVAIIGDMDVADFDADGWLDVVVLAKSTGGVGVCPSPGQDPPFELEGMEGEIQILFSPGNLDEITDGDAWQLVRLARSRLPGRRDKDEQINRTFPEFSGYTGVAAGEIDGINGPDIVVAYNPIECEFYDDEPAINRIELYANPGGDNMFDEGTLELAVVADAGADLSIPVPDPSVDNPDPVEVTLNGANSYSQFSNSILGGVSYFWEQIAGPDVLLAGENGASPAFIAPTTSALLTFRLTVDLQDAIDFDIVNVIVGEPGNLPPSIETTSEGQTVVPSVDDSQNVVVELLAVASDPNGDALTFSWQQMAGPPVVLQDSGTALASFTPPAGGGELRFRVTVSDGEGADSALVVVISGLWAPIRIEGNLPIVSDVQLSDVDLDGDTDILYTFPNSITSNISWARNPLIPHTEGGEGGPDAVQAGTLTWQLRPVGQVNTFADVFTIGDVDLDGFDDVLVRSGDGKIVQWFRHPGAADLEPIFPPPDAVPDRFNFPWQVYTMAEYDFRQPAGLAIGDLTGDGFNEVVIAAGGVVYWYDASLADSTYDSWGENFVVDDTKGQETTDDPDDPDFEDAGTVINAVTVVDIDGDGFGDVIATFDRRTFSGLNDDTLLWFRNTLGEQAEDEGGQ